MAGEAISSQPLTQGLCAGASPPLFRARVLGTVGRSGSPVVLGLLWGGGHTGVSPSIWDTLPSSPQGLPESGRRRLPLMLASQPERRDWVTTGVCPHAEVGWQEGPRWLCPRGGAGGGGCRSCCNLVCHFEGLGLIMSLCHSRGVI